MKSPKLIIELTDNGATIEIRNHLGYNEGGALKLCYTFDEENKEKLVDMLRQIDEFCMFDESRYAKERVHIDLVHGDKYECRNPDTCPICNKFDSEDM